MPYTRKRQLRGLILGAALGLAFGCGIDRGASISSSSHFLSCTSDEDCTNLPVSAKCSDDQVCVDSSGKTIERTPFFEDSFEGPTLDTSSFNFEVGQGLRNGEVQAYTNRQQNTLIEGGELVLIARAESYEGAAYTSASLVVKKPMTYGRVEVELLAPIGGGVTPAVWMLPSSPGAPVETCDATMSCFADEWPAWGSIVLMSGRADGTIVSGLDYAVADVSSGALIRSGSFLSTPVDALGTEYHTIAIEWGPSRIDWFHDDRMIQSIDLAQAEIHQPEGKNPFQQAFELMFSLSVGSTSDPPLASEYPKEMRIRSVRMATFP